MFKYDNIFSMNFDGRKYATNHGIPDAQHTRT
jgi:hypothetical protein